MFRWLADRMYGARLSELEGDVADLRERFARYQSRQAMRAAREEARALDELTRIQAAGMTAEAPDEALAGTSDDQGTLARRAELARAMRSRRAR